MKKLLALLIAVLLPAAAFAQTRCGELLLTVDEESCARMIAAMGMYDGDNAEEMCAALAKLMNGVGLRLHQQEEAVKLEMLLGGTALADVTAVIPDMLTAKPSGDQMVITSSLMEGYGLAIPMEQLLADDELADMLEKTDWIGLLGGMVYAGAEALSDVEVTSSRGSFSGDAYTGGAYCTTIMLDDSDVAALLSALMTDDLRALLTELLAYAGMDAAVLQEWSALHESVAAQNAHRYIIRMVEDAEGAFVGLSAVIMQGEKQLATLSVGMPDEETLHVVLGLGMGEENYWYSHVITGTLASLAGECIEFAGAKDEDFAFASAVATELLARRTWKLSVQQTDDQAAWSFALDMQSSASEQTQSVQSAGTVSLNDGTVKGDVNWLLDGARYMTLSAAWQACDPIATPDAASLTLCDITSASEEQQTLLQEITGAIGANLSLKLLQVIPMELLMNTMY